MTAIMSAEINSHSKSKTRRGPGSKVRSTPKPKHFVTREKALHQAELIANRVRKNYRHLARRFRRQNIDCFRLYDWDIPEIRAVVDWYAGHLVVAEYVRLQTSSEWLPNMARAVAKALDVPKENTHVKRRRTSTKTGKRYKKLDSKGVRFEARERDLRFWVNLDDYLDTGLFSDHRDTRVLIREQASGEDFLNLYAYTGAFTCAAVAGGAKASVTVDRSETYLKWARENLQLNGLESKEHILVQSDVTEYLIKAVKARRRFTLAMVDPPSFFEDERAGVSFDISRDHPELLRNVFKVMAPRAIVYFSTNHQRFEPRFDGLRVKVIEEITPQTIPEDYRNRQIHRCWRMTMK